jgi:hypothetical protein
MLEKFVQRSVKRERFERKSPRQSYGVRFLRTKMADFLGILLIR